MDILDRREADWSQGLRPAEAHAWEPPFSAARPRISCINELLAIYHDPGLRSSTTAQASRAAQVHYQLWRNMTFSEWMAREDHPQTKAFHVNLVRDGFEETSAAEFHRLVNPESTDRFCRLTWEGLYRLFAGDPALATMCRYLETKTAGLVRAFSLGTGEAAVQIIDASIGAASRLRGRNRRWRVALSVSIHRASRWH